MQRYLALIERDHRHTQRLADYAAAGIQVRIAESLPMKLALFDGSVNRRHTALVFLQITQAQFCHREGLGLQ